MALSYGLLRSGILNKQSEDWGTLASAEPKKVYTAYCTSNKCCEYLSLGRKKGQLVEMTKRKPQVTVAVSTKTRDCPNCKSALFWREE